MTFGTGTLRTGSTGDGVLELQQWLIDRGFLIALATPTGTFDDHTFHAVRAFQYSAGIGVDGVVGDGTRTSAASFAGTAASTGWHPTAIRNVQVDGSGGSYTTDTRRGVLHTTEGTRLPAYTSPPHFTVGRDGSGGAVQLWQHYPVSVAAKALRHPSGTPETNRHGAIQIEIIASAVNTPNLPTTDADLFQAIGMWMRWAEATAGVARLANHAFNGEASVVRLDDAAWASSAGWVGHQHVPNNDHWDPGQIDIATLLTIGVPTPTIGGAAPLGMPGSPLASHLGASRFQGTTPRRWDSDITTSPLDHGSGATVATTGARPTIRATTRQLTNAFPSLTFSISTGDLPYFEVLITTDRTLFDPSQATRRTVDNFFASRADGLRAAARSNGRYVAQVAAVQRFAESNPNGAQIYYTAIGYLDEAGSGPVPAADPYDLVRSAPAVTMMPGFHGHTATELLGVPLSMVRPAVRQLALSSSRARHGRFGGRAASNGGAPPRASRGWSTPFGDTPNVAEAGSPSIDAATDRCEGEDGYDIARRATPADGPPPVGSPAGPDSRAMPDISPAPGGTANGTSGSADGGYARHVDYDDGWGQRAQALGSSFPAGHPQPRALYDSEAPSVGNDDDFDDLGWGGTTYGDTADTIGSNGSNGSNGPGVVASNGSWRTIAPQLSPDQKRDVIEAFVGNDVDLYWAVGPDSEFAGQAGTDHPAYQRYHVGLSFGIAGFAQDPGELGQLVTMMQLRDAAKFTEVFGPQAGALTETLNLPGPPSGTTETGRSVRVQPVAGTDVWEEPWRSRFVEAGHHRPFQGAEIELAAGLYLDPVLQFATDLGLATPRALAIIFDRAAHRGVTGGMNWIIETVGPIQTPVLLRDALSTIGANDVESFQRTQPDLLVDDQFGPITHAALTAALRARGATSPPILTYHQMIDTIVQRATGQPWGDRIVRLAGAELSDDALRSELVG